MPTTFFDIGANSGSNSIHLGGNLEYQVYAFEPTRELFEDLQDRTRHFENYHLYPFAVSNESGLSHFNVAGQGDWGTSSLLNFSDNIGETWPGRGDLAVTDTRPVQVITLKEFCSWNKIRKIDFLHTDVQGVDIEVLMGLDDMVNIVQAGVLETARNDHVKLYKNQKYTLNDCTLWLYQNGFKIDQLELNDQNGVLASPDATLFQANEINIRYSRR